MANAVLDLGKFDEGGLKNNLEIKFKAWYLDCLEIHPFKVIRVLSAKLERYGFEWFRIKKINKLSNLQVEIVAQAYPREYLDEFEFTLMGPPAGYYPGGVSEVIPLQFGNIEYKNTYLEVEIVQGS